MVKTFSMSRGVARPEQYSEKNRRGRNSVASQALAADSKHNEDVTKTMTSGATITPT